jgi:hypothetical protein
MANMNYSKETIDFAEHIVFHYATYDADRNYFVPMHKVSIFDLYEFTKKLMLDDPIMASEATGPDNSLYCSQMLPALLKHLSDPMDKCLEKDFSQTWRIGVMEYYRKTMETILDDICQNKRFDDAA